MNLWQRYQRIPVQSKASIWYTICSFFQKGISFIAVPIYVRLLTTAEYGEWSVFQSWKDILIIFTSLNLYAGVYTKTLVDNQKDRDRYTSSMQGLGTTVTLVLLVVYLLTHKWCNQVIGLNTSYMLLLFLYFIVYPGFAFWTTKQRVDYKYRPMAIVTVVISVLTPIISVILLQNTDLRANALVLGYLSVQCAVGVVFYVYQLLKGKCFYDSSYWRYALKYNIPLIPHYLSLIVLNQSDRIMIRYYCGESDAGIYGFAYQLAFAINMLISSINGSRVPWTYEQLRSETYGGLRKITNYLILLTSSIVLLISFLTPEIISILGTADYQNAAYVIPVVTIGVYYTFVYDLYASVEFYYGATQYVMYASMTGAVLNIILNFIFIPWFGFIAAAYTTLFCYLVFMMMHFYFSRKVLQKQQIQEPIYNNKFIFGVSGLLTAIGLCSMLLFSYFWLRSSLLVLIITICLINRNKIIQIFKNIRKQ